MKRLLAAGIAAWVLAGATAAAAQDPFQWLEAPYEARALAWATEQTERSQVGIAALGERAEIRAELDALLAAGDPPPEFALLGPTVLKFQKTAANPHGVVSVARRGADGQLTAWRQVLDVAQLREAEGKPYEFRFYTVANACLPPEYQRCVFGLSPAGADDVELREFDLEQGAFVADGFRTAPGRIFMAWMDRDHLLIEHTLNGAPVLATGWPATVNLWARGTDLADAPVVYSAQPNDAIMQIGAVGEGEGRAGVINRAIDYSTIETILVRPDGAAEPTGLPLKIKMIGSSGTSLGGLIIGQLSEDAVVNGRSLAAETVFSYDTSPTVAPDQRVQVIYTPREGDFLADPYSGITLARNTARMVITHRGVARVVTAERVDGAWQVSEAAPEPAGTGVAFASSDPASEAALVTRSGYLVPAHVEIVDPAAPTVSLFQEAPAFDASRFAVDLKTATSRDGTEVDYYLLRPRNPTTPGATPTLMTGYGAFGISVTPGYLDSWVGGRSLAVWLNRGGALAVPMIRGGGERGAAWHRSAMREGRQNSYDDFAAVTEALIADGVTTPEHIGVFGSSNGGLLAAVMGTQRPDLYGAIVSDVPLTDLVRMPFMGMGAAWVNEYGDANDPAMLSVLNSYSPYQVVREGQTYPPFLVTIATSDNRVGAGHARKLAARLMEVGATTYFLEDQEGGHGVSDPLSRPDLMTDRLAFLINTLK